MVDTKKTPIVNKYTVSVFVGVLILVGGLFTVNVLEDKIKVTLPSDICNEATLTVTKDNFKLKCGWRVAFEADTVVDYYKTYGEDEWVRNNRYVGRNKKDITLYLEDKGNSFDIVRITKYRKGKQYIEDGTLTETYTFTKDKVKITYDYLVKNTAEHKISMRIKKQYRSYLDTFDINGYTGIQSGNLVYYKGFGDLHIDPSVSLITPATDTTTYNEGDTIPLKCQTDDTTTSVTLYWDASGTWASNGTETLTAGTETNTTFSRVIPHQTSAGTFVWNCYACNSSGCNFNTTGNYTVNPIYAPNTPNITSPEHIDANFLNGTGWGVFDFYPEYTNRSNNKTIFVNWTATDGHPDGDNITWKLYYYGTTTSTVVHIANSSINATRVFDWNISSLAVDDYYLTLEACSEENTSICANDSTVIPTEVFSFTPSISTDGNYIRYTKSSESSITKTPAIGQTSTRGIIEIDWLGYSYPTGVVNVTLNVSIGDTCTAFYGYSSDNSSSASTLTNYTKVAIINTPTADPNYIWLWLTKSSCSVGTTSETYSLEVLD